MRRYFSFFLILVILSSQFSSIAETIKLKSGKIIEAEISEKTNECIKVDISGISITYYFDQIESIGGVKVRAPLPKAAFSPKVTLPNNEEAEKSFPEIRAFLTLEDKAKTEKFAEFINPYYYWIGNEGVNRIKFRHWNTLMEYHFQKLRTLGPYAAKLAGKMERFNYSVSVNREGNAYRIKMAPFNASFVKQRAKKFLVEPFLKAIQTIVKDVTDTIVGIKIIDAQHDLVRSMEVKDDRLVVVIFYGKDNHVSKLIFDKDYRVLSKEGFGPRIGQHWKVTFGFESYEGKYIFHSRQTFVGGTLSGQSTIIEYQIVNGVKVPKEVYLNYVSAVFGPEMNPLIRVLLQDVRISKKRSRRATEKKEKEFFQNFFDR